jgi:hypothetical protein
MATNNTLDQDIQSRIESFLAELSGLVKRSALEAVHEALGGALAPARRGSGRSRGAPKTKRGPGRLRKSASKVARAGKRIRRSAEDLEVIAARVFAHVKSNAGHRLEEIGKALKLDTGVLKRPVAKLLEAKKLRTEGQKRGTKYFAGAKRGGGRAQSGGGGRKSKARPGRKAKRTRKASGKRVAKRGSKAKASAAPAAVAA